MKVTVTIPHELLKKHVRQYAVGDQCPIAMYFRNKGYNAYIAPYSIRLVSHKDPNKWVYIDYKPFLTVSGPYPLDEFTMMWNSARLGEGYQIVISLPKNVDLTSPEWRGRTSEEVDDDQFEKAIRKGRPKTSRESKARS